MSYLVSLAPLCSNVKRIIWRGQNRRKCIQKTQKNIEYNMKTFDLTLTTKIYNVTNFILGFFFNLQKAYEKPLYCQGPKIHPLPIFTGKSGEPPQAYVLRIRCNSFLSFRIITCFFSFNADSCMTRPFFFFRLKYF